MSQVKNTGYPSIDKTHLRGVSKKMLKPTTLPISFFGSFMLINRKRLEEPAIEQGNDIYFKQDIHDDVITLIKSFKAYLIPRGSRLAIITPNFYEGIVMTMAANAMGIQVVYFNPLATEDELVSDLNKYEPDVLFVYDRDHHFVDNIYQRTYADDNY